MEITQSDLTLSQREELTSKLLDNMTNTASVSDEYLYDLIRSGFKGLKKMSNAELLELHRDIFGEDYREEEEDDA